MRTVQRHGPDADHPRIRKTMNTYRHYSHTTPMPGPDGFYSFIVFRTDTTKDNTCECVVKADNIAEANTRAKHICRSEEAKYSKHGPRKSVNDD